MSEKPKVLRRKTQNRKYRKSHQNSPNSILHQNSPYSQNIQRLPSLVELIVKATTTHTAGKKIYMTAVLLKHTDTKSDCHIKLIETNKIEIKYAEIHNK